MAGKPKRIRDLTPDRTTRQAARVAVGRRLKKVGKRLPGAVESGGNDPEAVHELRTATRQADAALDAFRACLPGKRVRKARKLLKRIRKAAGEARDLDVQAALWRRLGREEPGAASAADEMLRRNRALRERAAGSFRAAAEGFSPKNIRKAAKRLEADARQARVDGEKVRSLGAFATRSLNELAGELLEEIEASDLGLEGLHAVRIREKKLRYAAEIFRHCIDAGPSARLQEDIKVLHDALGDQHDLFVARVLLDELEQIGDITDEVSRPLRGVVDDRLDEAHRLAVEELGRFTAIWLDPKLPRS